LALYQQRHRWVFGRQILERRFMHFCHAKMHDKPALKLGLSIAPWPNAGRFDIDRLS
jgi:hypothetical protein